LCEVVSANVRNGCFRRLWYCQIRASSGLHCSAGNLVRKMPTVVFQSARMSRESVVLHVLAKQPREGHSKWLVISAVLVATIGCSAGAPPANQVSIAATKSPARIEKLDTLHLPNAVRVHAKVISGGLPEGDAAFAELKSLGVTTVISVDGAKPDLAAAEKYGLRYVHLPHGYDGIPEQRIAELAKAVRDLPGQIYIHCHHGKHRSPAASAVACVGAGLIGRDDALAVLKVAGTSEHYRGLFESANAAHPLDQALLDQLDTDFPASAKLPAMAEAMVELENVHDHLKSLERAGWKTIASKPDLKPEHETLLLREHFTELLRSDEVKQYPDAFQQLMKLGETSAQQLEDALRASSSLKIDAEIPRAVTQAFKKVSDNCKVCHEQFRDVPLRQKTAR
jgi:protein tyrosine phosphatase (PTP) superfamily phosphohydrolase (DUF442 family)